MKHSSALDRRLILRSLSTALLLVGCGRAAPPSDAGPRLDGAPLDAGVALPPIPPRTQPCRDGSVWDQALRSSRYPLLVHHRGGERAVAEEVLGYLETAWAFEVDGLGFSPPLPDGARCGPDDAYDVFLWPGSVETYVEAIADHPATPHDDWLTYMVVDPFGEYGGEVLDATLAHELNHALQASDDWWESPPAFEMTAYFVEGLVFEDDEAWMDLLVDFQSRPDHSLDRNDDYETWYMYAAGLYLHSSASATSTGTRASSPRCGGSLATRRALRTTRSRTSRTSRTRSRSSSPRDRPSASQTPSPSSRRPLG